MAACVGLLPPVQGAPSSLGSDAHRYACKSYANKLLQNLCSLWHSQHFCDVEISAGEFVVKVWTLVASIYVIYNMGALTT